MEPFAPMTITGNIVLGERKITGVINGYLWGGGNGYLTFEAEDLEHVNTGDFEGVTSIDVEYYRKYIFTCTLKGEVVEQEFWYCVGAETINYEK
ncbi:MAG: hypothetical protein WC998_00755 [Candidatus Paceibacterota bacterium]|jgi:hypothetical protein